MLVVVLGGGLGSACRYLVCRIAERAAGLSFPWGTLAVNLSGCFLVGLLAGLADRALVGRALRLLAVTGFLGGFTTFSTFSLESVRMILGGEYVRGIVNLGASVLGGLALAAAGLFTASRL